MRAAFRAVAGDLKLAYAQFEELETFSRFGTRLIKKRARSSHMGSAFALVFQQPEFTPVAVPAQIAVLLALRAELFDHIPLDQMSEAEQALHQAAAHIPAAVGERLESADTLSDDDRATIIEIARNALARFQPSTNSETVNQ